MATMELDQHILRIRSAIQSGSFANEAAVSQGVVLPLLHALGWPVFDPRVVAPEYSVEGRRVDYALCDPPGKPVVFVEVKQAGHADGADRQLFEYAFHEGVPMAVLTDGQEWDFYLPAEQGRYDERRVYKLDMVERDVEECAYRLRRYLAYETIRSREAIANARKDYNDVHRRRQVEAALPEAWRKLVEGPDELLIDLLADQVESLCGYKPDPDIVARFLAERIALRPALGLEAPSPRTSQYAPKSPSQRTLRVSPTEAYYELHGRVVQVRSARDALARVFAELAERDPTFLERFAALPKHGRKRRYLARRAEELYPGRPDLARDHSLEVRPGWWIATNLSVARIEKILQMACEVAGLRYGRDLRVKLG